MFDVKTAYRHVVHAFDAGREVVLPGDVVGGAGRQDLDLGMLRQPLGNVPRVQLGTAVDGLTVALNDERDSHCS